MREVNTIELYSGNATSAILSFDNKLIATKSRKAVRIYKNSNAKKRPMTFLFDSSIVGVFFTSNNGLLVVTEDGDVSENVLAEESGKLLLQEISRKKVTAYSIRFSLIEIIDETEGKFKLFLGVQKKNNLEFCTLTDNSELVKLVNLPADSNEKTVAVSGDMIAYCDENSIHAVSSAGKKTKFEYTPKEKKFKGDGTFATNFVSLIAKDGHLVAAMKIGRIYFWSNFAQAGVSGTASISHWHKVSPQMALTAAGNILSAGAECALVRSIRGQKSTFLTRLIAPVTSLALSLDETRVVLVLEDNSIHVVMLSSMTIESSPPTFCYCQRSINETFIRDPLFPDTIVLNTKPGCLQWVYPSRGFTDRWISLTQENAVDGDMSVSGVFQAFKDVRQFSLNFVCAASVEEYVNFDAKANLRFWRRVRNEFELVSTIEVDDGNMLLSSCQIAYSPLQHLLVTAQTNGSINVYEYTENGQKVIEHVDRARKWQDAGITGITQIQKNGRFATAHERNVVLWNVQTMKVIEVQSFNEKVVSVDYCPLGRYILIQLESSIVSWDTSSLAIVWKIKQSAKIVSSFYGTCALINDQVMKFDPATGKVLRVHKFAEPLLRAVVLKTHTVVQGEKTIYCLPTPNEKSTKRIRKETIPHETPFHQLQASSANSENGGKHDFDHQLVVEPKPDASKMFAGPCHQLPPLSLLAPLFLQKALLPPAK